MFLEFSMVVFFDKQVSLSTQHFKIINAFKNFFFSEELFVIKCLKSLFSQYVLLRFKIKLAELRESNCTLSFM